MADRVSTKLFIQHPEDANIRLCGVLEQLLPDQPTYGRKIALVSLRYYSFLMPVVVNFATFFPCLDSSRNDGVSISPKPPSARGSDIIMKSNTKFLPDTKITCFRSG
jgi:hypothetical protein